MVRKRTKNKEKKIFNKNIIIGGDQGAAYEFINQEGIVEESYVIFSLCICNNIK